MTLSELKGLYGDNLLTEAVIEPAVQHEGWIVEFRLNQGNLVPLTDSSGSEQYCDSIDTATDLANQVGFKQARIID
ncbi:thymidylate kinase [Vibrio sp. SS-MA-C1-2]|uniref:thymidylate kinase n=1 Tax=Vibrio sp. SS-MA-C1-2 TaxID=2908646 RepID=UPI001F249AA3|nr:thymidylate kinase [Vibrio sp. SS-MA-C1-2]UJF19554.1 thymidylate kinase [Vibrio sp. SS-MA-C1-2]